MLPKRIAEPVNTVLSLLTRSWPASATPANIQERTAARRQAGLGVKSGKRGRSNSRICRLDGDQRELVREDRRRHTGVQRGGVSASLP
jgi:hypothetical protein